MALEGVCSNNISTTTFTAKLLAVWRLYTDWFALSANSLYIGVLIPK